MKKVVKAICILLVIAIVIGCCINKRKDETKVALVFYNSYGLQEEQILEDIRNGSKKEYNLTKYCSSREENLFKSLDDLISEGYSNIDIVTNGIVSDEKNDNTSKHQVTFRVYLPKETYETEKLLQEMIRYYENATIIKCIDGEEEIVQESKNSQVSIIIVIVLVIFIVFSVKSNKKK